MTPHLIEWQGFLEPGAIGVLRFEFVPKPSFLFAAAGMLSVLYQRRKRW